MRALIKEGRAVALAEVPDPVPAAGDVLVRVAYAGICRTDLLVADGRVAARSPVILGHELSGRVERVGEGVSDACRPGQLVSVDPRIDCGRCERCLRGLRCGPAREMLGIARHGGFAELVCVPAQNLVFVSPGTPLARAVWVEPVASIVGVLAANIRPEQRGVIYGRGRIAKLTRDVLAARGYRAELIEPGAPLERDAYGWAIETVATTATLAALIDALEPRGTLVLRSRTPEPVALVPAEFVMKSLSMRPVAYGDFQAAAAMLSGLDLAALTGATYPLEEWQAAFAAARASEERKMLFAIGER